MMTTHRRGDVVIITEPASDHGGTPRPAAVVRSDDFVDLRSLTVCPLTSVEEDAALLRLRVEPTDTLPLDRISWIMVDKITKIGTSRIGRSVGRLSAADMVRLDRALVVYLGIG